MRGDTKSMFALCSGRIYTAVVIADDHADHSSAHIGIIQVSLRNAVNYYDDHIHLTSTNDGGQMRPVCHLIFFVV